MKNETKTLYQTALLGVKNILCHLHLLIVSNENLNCPVFREILPKSLVVSKVSPFDFEYYVILIYRHKVSDRDCDVKVTFVFNISCVGVSVFSLLKKCRWGYNKRYLVLAIGALF